MSITKQNRTITRRTAVGRMVAGTAGIAVAPTIGLGARPSSSGVDGRHRLSISTLALAIRSLVSGWLEASCSKTFRSPSPPIAASFSNIVTAALGSYPALVM